jgi:chitodextrinase
MCLFTTDAVGAGGQAPTAPTNVHVTAATSTSITLAWTTSTDNGRVAGYNTYLDGNRAGSTTDTTYAYSRLTCGTSYTLAVEAFDDFGNLSERSAITASTTPCSDSTPLSVPDAGDSTPPSVPDNMRKTGSTTTTITLAWDAATDNVGVAGYSLFLNDVKTGSTTATSYTFTGLTCGTTYSVGLVAYDAAGNSSDVRYAIGPEATTACSTSTDATPPSAPTGLRQTGATTTSVTIAWNASTDNVGVAGYSVWLNGAKMGTTTTTLFTYSSLWCGTSYTVALEAFDAAGNTSDIRSATSQASTSDCQPPPPGGAAGYFVSPGGSDAGGCSQAAPCRSFARAFAVAPAGAVVQVADGFYGCDPIAGTKSADVTFVAAPSAHPSTTCELFVNATHVAFTGVDLDGLRMAQTASNITLHDVDITCKDAAPYTLYGGTCSAGIFGAPSEFAMYGGSVGPTYDDDSVHAPGNSQIGIPYDGGPYEAHNILFDGVRFHDNRLRPGAHSECLMVGGGNGITIRNSRFDHCAIFDIYFTWWNFASPPYPPPTNILLENNWFQDPNPAGYAVRFGDYMTKFVNITVRYNSSTGLITMGDSPKSNVNFIANVGPLPGYGCTAGITYAYNVWDAAKCSTTDRTAPAGFLNTSAFDLRLKPGSAGIDHGDRRSFPRRDIFGRHRPRGRAPDAGAVET